MSSSDGRFFDNTLRRLVSNSALMGGSTAVSAVLGLLQTVLFTRVLGAEKYGQLVLIMGVTTLVRQLFSVRVWEWVMKEYAAAQVQDDVRVAGKVVSTGYLYSLGVNALALVVVLVSARFSAQEFLKDPQLAFLVIVYSLTLLTSWTYDTSFAVLRVSGQFRFLAVQGAVGSVVRLLAFGAVLLVSKRLDFVVWTYVALETGISTWLQLEAGKSFRHRFKDSWRHHLGSAWAKPTRDAVKLLAISSVIDTVKMLGARADVFVLASFRSPADVGIYQAAYNFIDGLNRLAQPMTMVAFADLAKLGAAKDGDAILGLAKRISALMAAVLLPGCVLTALLSPWLVNLVYGPKYPGAAPLLAVLIWSMLWLMAIWAHPSYVSVGKPHWSLQVLIVATVAKLVALFTLVPTMGPMGVAIATTLYFGVYVVTLPVYYLRLKSHIRSPEFRSRPQPDEDSLTRARAV
jgi:O-antigen/teichoic acid export membrane protein